MQIISALILGVLFGIAYNHIEKELDKTWMKVFIAFTNIVTMIVLMGVAGIIGKYMGV